MNRPPRLAAAVALVAASAVLAAASLHYAAAFHRTVTFHRVEPQWPGLVLPVAAAAGIFVALIVARLARPWWGFAVVAWLMAALPAGCTGVVLYDHVDYGPHNGDIGAGRLHQIGLGLLLYSIDHGHALPPDLPTLVRAVGLPQSAFVGCEYDGTTTDVTDPERVAAMIRSPQYNGFTYVGSGLRDDAPADTVVAFSRGINGLDGGDVLFGDGHVDWLTGADAQFVADHARPGGPPVRCRPGPTTRLTPA